MPTESTFRDAALALDQIALGADELLLPTRAALGPDVLQGGAFTADVQRLVERTAATAQQVAAACRDAATECRRRADACHAYWQEVARWETADERYGRLLRAWEGRQRAHLDDQIANPPAGPRPTSPGPRPQPPYGWIG